MVRPPAHVVCATDFSAAAAAAARRAAAVAAQHGARLTLLHVVPESLWEVVVDHLAALAGAAAPSPEAVLAQAAALVEREAAGLHAGRGGACATEVRHGRPAAQIAAAASDLGADLLVIGAAGEHSAAAQRMGATALKLLRTAPCPVLIVKRPPPFDYATVLLPTDFSAPAARAAECARALAPEAVFHLVHAFELPYDGLMRYAGVDDAAVAQYRSAASRELAARLARIAADFAPAPGRAVAHVRHGYAPTRIDEWIVELGVDLVAIAAHGKSEIEAAFLGSVSAHVVQTAACDVLLVRGAQHPRT